MCGSAAEAGGLQALLGAAQESQRSSALPICYLLGNAAGSEAHKAQVACTPGLDSFLAMAAHGGTHVQRALLALLHELTGKPALFSGELQR